jgi:hypothetical protein
MILLHPMRCIDLILKTTREIFLIKIAICSGMLLWNCEHRNRVEKLAAKGQMAFITLRIDYY